MPRRTRAAGRRWFTCKLQLHDGIRHPLATWSSIGSFSTKKGLLKVDRHERIFSARISGRLKPEMHSKRRLPEHLFPFAREIPARKALTTGFAADSAGEIDEG